jgi:hypothetical protein
VSHFTYRDETSIFVIDVHSFYDEMIVVIEVYSFYDKRFSSLMYPLFVITCRLSGCQMASATLAADVSCARGTSTWLVHVAGDVAS